MILAILTNLFRNWGIIIALMVFGCAVYLIATEKISAQKSKGEVLLFRRRGMPDIGATKADEESNIEDRVDTRAVLTRTKTVPEAPTSLQKQTAIFHWDSVNYDIKIKGEPRRLLDDVDGWVKPGTLTALMGVSGAGKTTLLDVLASRTTMGVITGQMMVDGRYRDTGFQRKTGYVQQQDLHLATSTVREALTFSAILRQPRSIPKHEKIAYVDEVIKVLEMETYADAIVGVPGEGLNVEQRKRLTIGVELAAKPALLLFLDEPTSGLDSQTAWSICALLRKLADHGQAILCTIHQPNAALFENFDRLLLLQRGGQTVYFGDIGKDACVLLDYFRRHGAECPPDANPAEYMLDAVGAGQAPRVGDRDWADIFLDSPELAHVKETITTMKTQRLAEVGANVKVDEAEFATPLMHQLKIVQKRTNLSFWRSPNYGFTRLFNHVIIAILTGLAYLNLDDSKQSLQYRVFVIFQVTVLPALILAQVEPKYALSRMIYYREASSKMYGQFAFASSLVVAEIPYSILCAVGFFLPLYYMPGFNHSSSRAGYQFLIVLITELFAVTLGQMVAAITPSPFISALLNPFIIITFALFCGVTIPKAQIPKFWRAWLYQLDPFTRLIGGMVVTELHGAPVVCTQSELNSFNAPAGQTCGEYMKNFFAAGGPGYIVNDAVSRCEYCAYNVGDQFYQNLGLDFDNRWRDLGILAAFIGSNLIFLFLGVSFCSAPSSLDRC